MIKPCGERRAVVGAPRGDGTGRYCSNKRRKIAHNWLDEGGKYHRYGKQGRIKLFLCIDRIPGCLPAAAGRRRPFDPPTSLVGLAQPASFCHLCLPPKMFRPGMFQYFKDSKRRWAGCWLGGQDTLLKMILHLNRQTFSLATRNALSFPVSSRHKEGTGRASSSWNASHPICSHARARCSTATTQSPVFSCPLRDS